MIWILSCTSGTIMVNENNATKSRPDPLSFVAKMIFFTKVKGLHKDYLTSFELALLDAFISDLNLVSISSIMPPECKIVTREEGKKHLLPGQITFTVMAKSATNEPNRLIAASIGLARPADQSQYGYYSEHHSFGETAQRAGDYAEDMPMEMLATTIRSADDPSLTWNQREEQWKLSGKIYKTQNITNRLRETKTVYGQLS